MNPLHKVMSTFSEFSFKSSQLRLNFLGELNGDEETHHVHGANLWRSNNLDILIASNLILPV